MVLSSTRGRSASPGGGRQRWARTRLLGASGTAFTLIELLVVVAVIALLVGLLLPTLNRARAMSRRSLCMTNQRAIVTGLKMYHAQWNCFPYNYAHYHPYRGRNERWALGCISPYVGGPADEVDLRGKDEGEFPRAYVCPSADLQTVYAAAGNVNDKYHACYWTNVAVRVNMGFGLGGSKRRGGIFNTWIHEDMPPGWDIDSGGEARFSGKTCPRWPSPWSHWRSVYHPTMDSINNTDGFVFSGDTRNSSYSNSYYSAGPGEWHMRPGWGYIHGSLGFDRHLGSMVVSYVDGHVRAFPEVELNDYSFWTYHYPHATRGDWMIKYTGNDGCGGTQVHSLREALVH